MPVLQIFARSAGILGEAALELLGVFGAAVGVSGLSIDAIAAARPVLLPFANSAIGVFAVIPKTMLVSRAARDAVGHASRRFLLATNVLYARAPVPAS